MKNKILVSIAAGLSVLGLSVGSAFAWTYGLSGTGACQEDGSFKITWKVDNTSENEALHITASSNTAVVPVGTDVAAGHVQNFSQMVTGTAAASFSLHLTGNFPSDQTLRTHDATVTLGAACSQGGRGGEGGGDKDKVTLCHATDSNTNPYVQITVAAAGAYNGHYREHQGGIYPGSDGKWGDIIPPFSYHEQSYSLNWTTQGQAIYNNGCKIAGGQGGGEGGGTTTTTTPTTPAVTPAASVTTTVTGGRGAETAQVQTPTGGVGAGEGGAAMGTSVASLFGLVGSLSAAGYGFRRLSKQQG